MSDESEGCTVGLSVLTGNDAGQSLEGKHGAGSASTTCGKDQWGRSSAFHLEDSLLVCSPFLSFVSAVCGAGG